MKAKMTVKMPKVPKGKKLGLRNTMRSMMGKFKMNPKMMMMR